MASCLLNGSGSAFLVQRWEHRGCCSSEENSWHKRLALAPGWIGGQVHKGGTRAQGLHHPLPLVHFPLEVTLSPLSPGLRLPFLPSPQPLSSFLGLVTQELGPTLSRPEAEVTHPMSLEFTHHTPTARAPGWSMPYSPPRARPRQGHCEPGGGGGGGHTS